MKEPQYEVLISGDNSFYIILSDYIKPFSLYHCEYFLISLFHLPEFITDLEFLFHFLIALNFILPGCKTINFRQE